MNRSLEEKHESLLRDFEGGSLLVAFSGGVDSSLLLAVAKQAKPERLVAVTGVSPSLSEFQLAQARRVAGSLKVEHRLLGTRELEDANYAANPDNRCYFCKHELYGRLRERFGDEFDRILDGTNADDLGGHRPGHQAAREAGVESPLAMAGLGKNEVRELSRRYDLDTAELPASPCLSSRVKTGVPIDIDTLARIEAAESAVRSLGFREFRVRDLGDRARFELAADEQHLLGPLGGALQRAIRNVGFDQVEIDERPLQSGRLSSEGRGDEFEGEVGA